VAVPRFLAAAQVRSLPLPLPDLPVTAVLPELAGALAAAGTAVLTAPPGAGKSTIVPLALLGSPWLGGQRIVLLEPRRLAARALAARMASLLGEETGATVGYRMRQDTRVSRATRLEVVTEGVLTRMLQADPALEGVGALLFDEFHERSLQADLGLALALDVRANLRPDLRLLVMSATLQAEPVAALLDGAPIVTAAGRSFPVATHYLASRSDEPLPRAVASAVRRALAETTGDVLVFLPGTAEIRRSADFLAGQYAPPAVQVRTLYGDLSRDEQDAAIRPAPPGERKVLLSTNIAETSLTIEGITAVVDSGLERRSRFDPNTGLGSLVTDWISRASADQRQGRAGRLGPGVCYRLWGEARQRSLLPATPPEIVATDLAPLALELAAWGVADPAALRWLDAPPPGAFAQARELLGTLGALDEAGRITSHGRELQRLGVHPRLAHLLLHAREQGLAATAAALAALLSERDLLRGEAARDDADIRTRLELLRAGGPATRHIRRAADDLLRRLGNAPIRTANDLDPDAAGALLAVAWPDRVGRAREAGSGRYQLATGRGANLGQPQALSRAEFIVAPAVDAGARDARIFLAAPLTLAELQAALPAAIRTVTEVAWEPRDGAVVARRRRVLGELSLADEPVRDVDPATLAAAFLAGLQASGLDVLPWEPVLRQWQARVALAHAWDPRPSAPWPDVSDAALLASLPEWLGPWVAGMSRLDHLRRLDLGAALRGLLDHGQQRRLDELAPTHLAVPSGSRIAIDYLDGPVPTLSVRLQEVFGLQASPAVCAGRVPVLLKLLSPAGRPVQVTRDLASFWASGYHEVRRELKGRYPKHYWPDDPLTAEPTRRARPR
jgi:ATP-dependent helicase HrpB